MRGALDALDVEVVRLVKPTQREIAEMFERGPVERAVVVSGEDAFALQTALMVRDADPRSSSVETEYPHSDAP